MRGATRDRSGGESTRPHGAPGFAPYGRREGWRDGGVIWEDRSEVRWFVNEYQLSVVWRTPSNLGVEGATSQHTNEIQKDVRQTSDPKNEREGIRRSSRRSFYHDLSP